MTAEARGEVEDVDGVLVIRRIHVAYRLRIPAGHAETVERVHARHHRSCPVYRSLEGGIEITTDYTIEEDG